MDISGLPIELQEKVKKAKKIRETGTNSFIRIFYKPDYMEAAILYEEVAESDDLTDEIKIFYYTEAAESFKLVKSEFSTFKASETYYKIYEMVKNVSRDESAKFLLLSAEALESIKNYELSGIKYNELASLYEIDQLEKAFNFYVKVVEGYEEVVNYKYNARLAKKKLLSCALFHKNVEYTYKALTVYKYDFNRYKFCLLLIMYLMGKHEEVAEEDLKDSTEREIIKSILGLVNDDDGSIEDKLHNFVRSHALDDIEISIIQLFIENSTTTTKNEENEYC